MTRKSQSNRTIKPIERNQTVEFRFSNAIESRSLPQFLDSIEILLCFTIGSIEIRLRSIEMEGCFGLEKVGSMFFFGSESGFILSSFRNRVKVVLHGYLPAK